MVYATAAVDKSVRLIPEKSFFVGCISDNETYSITVPTFTFMTNKNNGTNLDKEQASVDFSDRKEDLIRLLIEK